MKQHIFGLKIIPKWRENAAKLRNVTDLFHLCYTHLVTLYAIRENNAFVMCNMQVL